MKKIILPLLVFAALIMIAGCSKDNASSWTGVYTSTGTLTDSVNQVTITEVNSSTLKIQLQAYYGGVAYTFATIQRATLASATTLTVNETGNIAGYPDLYTFTGSGVLSGNSVTISGEAVNTTNSSDVKLYYFTGAK